MPAVAGAAALSTIGKIAVSVAISVAFSVLQRAFASKPGSTALDNDFATEARGRAETSRTASAPGHFVYGKTRVALSPLVAWDTDGADNKYLYAMGPLAWGRHWQVDQVFVNNEPLGALDENGLVTDGRFADDVTVSTRVGFLDAEANPAAIGTVPGWSVDDRGIGICDLMLRLERDTVTDNFPNGFGSAEAVVWGRPVYDPRAATVAISTSSAAAPAVFEAAAPHGLAAGDMVYILDHAGAEYFDPVEKRMRGVAQAYQVSSIPQEGSPLAPSTTKFTLVGPNGAPLELSSAGTGGTLSKMVWSNNAALCARDWFTAKEGYGAPDSEVNAASVIAAANICDTQVPIAVEVATFTAIGDGASPESFSIKTVAPQNWRTGDGVQVSSSGTLPGGLAAGTDYFLIETSATEYALASSLEDARAGTAVTLTDQGAGAHRLRRNSQLAYTVDGRVLLNRAPADVMDELITAMAGARTWVAGQCHFHAGAAVAASGTLTAQDKRSGDLLLLPVGPIEDKINGARAKFIDPGQSWARVDVPPYQNPAHVATDGEAVWGAFDFPFCDDPTRGTRLLKIATEQSRLGETFEFPAKPRKANTGMMDVETVDLDIFLTENKEFQVVGYRENPADGGISLKYREYAPAVFDWDRGRPPSAALTAAAAPRSPFTVYNPITLRIDTVSDGASPATHSLSLSWVAPADEYVTDGGTIAIQYRASAASPPDWQDGGTVAGDATAATVAGVTAGAQYDVRIRAVNNLGVPADTWQTISGYTATVGVVGGVELLIDDGAVASPATSPATDDGSINSPVGTSVGDGTIA